jgi:iron(III) transport system substrate-binding protein
VKKVNIGLVMLLIVVLRPVLTAAQSPLIEKAKAEKEVTLYGSTNASVMQKVIQGFEKRYPFLKVNYNRTRGDKVMQKVTTEQKAGYFLADVINVKGSFIYWLKTQGVFDRYESPERKYIRDLHKDKDGLYTGVYTNFEFIGYNKKLVSAAELPKSPKDLLNPKWRGKMALDSRDYEWYISQIHLMGGEGKAGEYMKQLARQDIQIRDGHGLLAQLLAAGEFSLQLTLRDELAEELMKSGAPIDWVAFEPVIPNAASGVGIGKNPPHPNAARLFIDFVLSRDGQELYQSTGRTGTRTDLAPPNERIRKLKYGQIDWANYFERLNKFEKEYDGLFVQREFSGQR